MAHSRATLSTISTPRSLGVKVLRAVPYRGCSACVDVLVGGKQKAAGAAGRIKDDLVAARTHHVHNGADQRRGV